MSEDTDPSDPANWLARWEAQRREQEHRIAEVRPLNKAAIFDALAAAGITAVLVEFDGCGDSGQIENMSVVAGEGPAELPTVSIEFVEPVEGSDELRRRAITLGEAIEALVYEALEQTHPGWEINDGAFGELTFDVERRAITLAFNGRHMECDYSEHAL